MQPGKTNVYFENKQCMVLKRMVATLLSLNDKILKSNIFSETNKMLLIGQICQVSVCIFISLHRTVVI